MRRSRSPRLLIEPPAGQLIGLIGPDGVVKSTMLSMIAGSRQVQTGRVTVLGNNLASSARRAEICPRIAYMPQGLAKNLYADISVRENIEFFSRLFGQSSSLRQAKIAELLASKGLAPFSHRLAKKLSGGMRQKLGLCCCLIDDPDLRVLDEPATGADPLARRQFWELIDRMRSRREGMSLLVATAYMVGAKAQLPWRPQRSSPLLTSMRLRGRPFHNGSGRLFERHAQRRSGLRAVG